MRLAGAEDGSALAVVRRVFEALCVFRTVQRITIETLHFTGNTVIHPASIRPLFLAYIFIYIHTSPDPPVLEIENIHAETQTQTQLPSSVPLYKHRPSAGCALGTM